MSKQCKICTDRHEKAGQELCPKCHRLSGLGFDRIVICTFHSERIPKRAERYLAQIELFRQEDREKSERLREEFARQLTVSDFRQGIKYCRSRSGGRGKPSRIYRCPRCGSALASRSCLSCEMDIKGLLK